MIYALIHIINYYKDNSVNEEIQQDIIDNIVIIEVDEDTKEENYTIDFEELKKQNSDTVAYIKINNTNIDYPVVKTSNNTYYLKHNFNKKYNSAGWLFADYHNKFDGSDKNIVIYGHSMLNGSMFGTLKNVLKNNFDEDEILFITNDGQFIYQIFSAYIIEEEDYYINTYFKDNNDFEKFVKTLKSRSKYKYDVEVSGSDTILTLSTCSGNTGNKRTVVHAKKID